MSGYHPPSPGTEATPAPRRRRDSLAGRKAELYQRLRSEDAEDVAEDLMAQARAGDLLAIQLLLLYTLGPAPDGGECATDETTAEDSRSEENEAAPQNCGESVPPAVSKPTFPPPDAVLVATGVAAAVQSCRRQTVRRAPGRALRDLPPRAFDAGVPSPNGDSESKTTISPRSLQVSRRCRPGIGLFQVNRDRQVIGQRQWQQRQGRARPQRTTPDVEEPSGGSGRPAYPITDRARRWAGRLIKF